MKNPFKTGRFFVADRGIEHAGGHECLLSGPHMDSDTANQLKRAFKRAGMSGATVLYYPPIQVIKQEPKA